MNDLPVARMNAPSDARAPLSACRRGGRSSSHHFWFWSVFR